jgi:uncharacterized DUF497 family protein
VRIVWDEPKRVAILRDRNLDFEDVTLEFFASAVLLPGQGRRFRAVGILNGRPTTVVFERLGTEALALVTIRPASKKKRSLL